MLTMDQLDRHGSDHDAFPESHFNLGLAALLSCLDQLMTHVHTQARAMRFPYKVSTPLIGGCSILYLKKPTEWTKAVKYMMTNLKWLLTWVSSIKTPSQRPSRPTTPSLKPTTQQAGN